MSKTNDTTIDKTVQEVQTVPETVKESPYDLVEIQLFKDNRRYKDDLHVLVNGRNWVIKRGMPVQVPRYVANVIRRGQKQDQASDAMVTSLVERYEERTRTETQA